MHVLLGDGAVRLNEGTEGDYDRACAAMYLVGVLELPEGGEALVLRDEPLSTACLPAHRLLVRWCYAESRRASLRSSWRGFRPPSGTKGP
ncbi:Imm21 family immunity protein [Streptomyces sp. NBC_01102]|uniref:Imm21 family immunity protein n=1 Tax=Streptomyces sp. NBC_01102 TaxID=2903749 RepID=UPI00386E6777